MERDKENPLLGFPTDGDDAKYVSGLSTILVATIQEAKDRISQVEYIFCSQLFPNFQSKSKCMQKVYLEARKAAEDEWREKEHDLLRQIKNLQLEKKRILEENQTLEMEKMKYVNRQDPLQEKFPEVQEELKQKTQEIDKLREVQLNMVKALEAKSSLMLNNENIMKELEEKNNFLLTNQRKLEQQVQENQSKLMKKSKEVDEGMELHSKLLQLIQSNETSIFQKEKQLKEQEETTRNLLAKYESLGKTVDMIEEQLSLKSKEVDNEKELKEKLIEDIESLRLQKSDYEQILNSSETEKKQLENRVQIMEGTVIGLQKKLHKKNEEVAAGKKFQEQLLQQIDLHNSKMLKNRQQAEGHENEKKLHLAERNGLEDNIDKFRMDLREQGNVTTEGIQLHGKLLEQIEAKNSELLSEKKKRTDITAAYKSLKSQYKYLCSKFGLNTEGSLPENRMDNESSSLREDPNPSTSPAPKASIVACNFIKEKEILEDTKGMRSIQRSRSNSPSAFNSPIAPSDMKPGPLRGTKRPGSSWRDTRSNQRRSGPDPHDDFLDTPLENIRENIKNPLKEEVHNLPDLVPQDMNSESSDDETQDVGGNLGQQIGKMPAPMPAANAFKYVEPVRKKAERENLKGIECKQCRKFYDAVLPDDAGDQGDGNKQQLRCEHHQGVSRHRYRYAPPSTPEGFWNIGFESEM